MACTFPDVFSARTRRVFSWRPLSLPMADIGIVIFIGSFIAVVIGILTGTVIDIGTPVGDAVFCKVVFGNVVFDNVVFAE
jgi:hypothetical protein